MRQPRPGRLKKPTNPQVAQSLESLQLQMANVKAQIQARNMEMEERTKRMKELQAEIAAIPGAHRIHSHQRAALCLNCSAITTWPRPTTTRSPRRRRSRKLPATWKSARPGENLETLDPASLPEQASEPNRLLIAGAGTGMGLFFGVFMAGVKEMKDTSLKNLKDVRAYTNLPVLSSIPLARERAVGAPQAPPVLVGMVHRHHHWHDCHEQLDVLLLFR